MKYLSEFPSKEVTTLKQLKKEQTSLDTTILAVLHKKTQPFYKEYEATGDKSFCAMPHSCAPNTHIPMPPLTKPSVLTANALRGKHVFVHTFSQELGKHFKVALNSLVLMHPELLTSQYEEKVYTLSKVSNAKFVSLPH